MLEISARNQLTGTITSIVIDGVSAEVSLDIRGGNIVTAVITRGSVERLKLSEGDKVTALVKATDVLIGKSTGDVS